MAFLKRSLTLLSAFSVLSGCAGFPGNVFIGTTAKMEMVQGPPVEDVVTAFDEALSCLRGKVQKGVTFAVGQIVDATGKQSYAEGASGKFVTQGSGEMVQSALFRAGVTVVNRRDPNILVVETQWGIRDLKQQIPVNFYISGSINSLAFIPGGGFSAQVGGVGPRYRQNRILIGLDLTMTDAMTGRIVASVPLQKQIFSREVGASMGRFFGNTLVSRDMRGQQREAVHLALRQMVSCATLERGGQVMNKSTFQPCKDLVSEFYGEIRNSGTSDPAVLQQAAQTPLRVAAAAPQNAPQTPRQNEASKSDQPAVRSIEEQVKELANHAMVFGARAVAAAEESLAADSLDVSAQKAAEATELLRGAVQILQRAAELGLSGPEGDAVALVVERGMGIVKQAQDELAVRTVRASVPVTDGLDGPSDAAELGVTPTEQPQSSAPPPPGTVDAQRRGIE